MTRPVLAVMAGWFDGRIGADIHAQLAEFNPVKISSPWKHGGWPSKRLLGWKTDSYIDKQAPDRPYVALGFSWGATAAARLAERDANCRGLIYVSGTEWMPGEGGNFPVREWRGFPVMCLATAGEKWALISGTMSTRYALEDAGADVGDWFWKPAPNPGTHKRPHLAGVAHHCDTIRHWMDKHF